jgi:drug/metabolite transporter (DMT)-like permease
VLGVLGDLVRSPLWLLGWFTNLLGFLLQGAALHFGSVALVQPLLVTQLLFTLPLVSIWTRRRPARRDWLSGISICIGIAVFLSVRDVVPNSGSADRLRILLACAATALLIVLLVLAAAGRSPSVHASAIAVAAGLCFALSAVMMKLTATDLVERGVGATAVDWPGYALAATTLVGLLLEQEAFRAGSLPISVAAMSITNPIASYLIGVLAFHVNPPDSVSGLFAIAVSGALLFAGAAGLAGSAMVRADAPDLPRRSGTVQPDVR